MGAQRALGRGRRSPAALDTVVVGLVDRLARRLRYARRVCRTVVLRLRFDDFKRASRSRTLVRATSSTDSNLFIARALLVAARPLILRRGVTLVGITLSGIERDSGQLALPLDGHEEGALDTTLDAVRERFGTAAITRATLLGSSTDPGLTPWLEL
jgi:DNA polymerase-4